MFYQVTSLTNTLVIPNQLLKLFDYYEIEIQNTAVSEFSEEYIINKLLNEKKSQKHLQKHYLHM